MLPLCASRGGTRVTGRHAAGGAVISSTRMARWLQSLVVRVLGRSEFFLAGTFAALILIGAILLRLPAAHARTTVGFLDALFTSTSAVCVTGLAVVDTGRDYSRFGQAVIMLLIQFGGLGILTFTAIGTQFMGLRMSFRQQALLADSFFQSHSASQIRVDLKRIVGMTLLIELVGAVLIYLDLRDAPEGHSSLFSAAFHSISAFCNAGFSLYADNLVAYRSRLLFLFTIMALIVFGGLGHSVTLEMARRAVDRLRRRHDGPVQWSLHSRVVLRVTALLIIGGALGILVFGLTADEGRWGEKVVNALFQSITARTAGFNSVNIGALPLASLLVLIVLMFIGGSPCSCAGGIKTTSAATWLAMLRARLNGRRDVSLLGRRLPDEVIARAVMVVSLAVLWHTVGCIILALTELPAGTMKLQDILFEQTSAFGTVGLSTGITPHLSPMGKVWIIASMFVGRVGPLTAALAVLPIRSTEVRYTEERLMIG